MGDLAEEFVDFDDPVEADRVEFAREIVIDGRRFRLQVVGNADDSVEVGLVAADAAGNFTGRLGGTILAVDLAAAARALVPLLKAAAVAFGHVTISRKAAVEDIRRRHPNAYRPWTTDEETRLAERYEAGASVRELSEEFGRQLGAVTARLVQLGLIARERYAVWVDLSEPEPTEPSTGPDQDDLHEWV